MLKMFLIHNYPDLHYILGAVKVVFVKNEDEYQAAFLDAECATARGPFLGQIPTARLVEIYTKRGDPVGCENGNDFVFVNAFCSPKTREQAFDDIYGEGTSKKVVLSDYDGIKNR